MSGFSPSYNNDKNLTYLQFPIRLPYTENTFVCVSEGLTNYDFNRKSRHDLYDLLVLLCTLYVAKTGGRESPLTFLIVGEDVQTFEGTCGATGM